MSANKLNLISADFDTIHEKKQKCKISDDFAKGMNNYYVSMLINVILPFQIGVIQHIIIKTGQKWQQITF